MRCAHQDLCCPADLCHLSLQVSNVPRHLTAFLRDLNNQPSHLLHHFLPNPVALCLGSAALHYVVHQSDQTVSCVSGSLEVVQCIPCQFIRPSG
jgi:hypothetical protein